MKAKIIIFALLCCSMAALAQQKNLKVTWGDYKLLFDLPYPADNGYEIDDEFGFFYVYSNERPLVLYTTTCIDNKDVTAANYKELFAKSMNVKDVTTQMLDNGLFVVQFKLDDSDNRCAFAYLVSDKMVVASESMDLNDGTIEHLKKISITKK